MSSLFEPFRLRNIALRNRIVASPMCQYQALTTPYAHWLQNWAS
jgi:2,4-dienoyl-CoA reductase-like NADH-dependent reductase (Old Yellow Enzyme family)